MAKTIKFNLILDNKPIRDIKGLQENFCINDVLEFYKKGLLQKWLKVRGFDEYLNKVNEIKDNKPIIIQLIKIFDIEESDKEINETTYSLDFWNERKVELQEWNKKDCKVKDIIADYHNGYDTLKGQIIENKEDMPFMKNATKEVFDKYLEIFKIDYKYFFNEFKNEVPFIIYAVLMNENLRKFFLENKDIFKITKSVFINDTLAKRKRLYNIFDDDNGGDDKTRIRSEINDKIKQHIFRGITDGYWKDLETVNTKIMVLSIPAGTFITTPDKPKEELSVEDVNGKFIIMDGLLYKSNVDTESIVYMEV